MAPTSQPHTDTTDHKQIQAPSRRQVLPLVLFPSREVLQVSLLYLRVISACGDGKIRIYNFLNGNCLKVIKVDARGDPVLSFFYQGNRWVVGRCVRQTMSTSLWFSPSSFGTLDLLAEQNRPRFPLVWLREVSSMGLTDLCPRLSDRNTIRAVTACPAWMISIGFE